LKQAGAEFEQKLSKGPITRLQAGTAVEGQHNPAFDEDDNRRRAWMRAERAAGPLRAGATMTWERVTFGEEAADLRSVGADVTIDTRLDPALPRNAVYARASWTRTDVDGAPVDRRTIDARGYLGLIGQTVIVGRLAREDASHALPDYLKSLVGGWSSLRGFEAGSFVGDTAVTGSAEFRVPLSSPLSVARVGISIFVDAGTAYDEGQRFADQPIHVGIGAGGWLTATVFRLGVSVAHGRHADTRVNFGVGMGF
jgi:outer membrane protein assembly factor BamA